MERGNPLMFENGILWKFNKDKSGLEFAYTDEIQAEYEALFKQIFKDLNTEPSTPAGQLITYLTELDTKAITTQQNMLNYFFLGGGGKMLDLWAYNQYRIKRKKGLNGSVSIDISGVPFTKIPKGFKVSDGENVYILENDTQIGENGKVSAHFIAEIPKETISLANKVTQIVTSIVGVERVTNPAPSVAGILTENDSALYLRCQQYGSIYKNSSFASILANVSQVKGVTKIGGYENISDNQVTFLGFVLKPHSFVIVVQGGDDKEIAETIAQCKPPGSAMNGDTEIELLINDKKITYAFQRPKLVKLKVDVSCGLYLNSPSIYADLVKNAVLNYINALEIGDFISQPALSQSIVKEASGFDVKDVKVGKKDSGTSYNPIQLNLDELATIDLTDINVVGNQQ